MLLQHILDRFSFMNSARWNEGVEFALFVIWLLVVACVVSSVLSQPFDYRQRIFWIAMVILLPGIGLLAYLPFAFHKENLPHMFQRKHKNPRRTDGSQQDSEP